MWIMAAECAGFGESLAEMEAVLLGTEDVDVFLRDLAVLAARSVGEDLSCGIMLQHGAVPQAVASSDVMASQVDELQYSLEKGPCLHAMRTGERVRVDDLMFDQRWWEYAVRALARGVRSSLSIPLSAQGNSVGAMNLYSDRPGFFGEAQTRRAEQFAAEASAAADLAARLADQAEPL
jgi:GAF domain-containing protein